jgi:hypothetical protein
VLSRSIHKHTKKSHHLHERLFAVHALRRSSGPRAWRANTLVWLREALAGGNEDFRRVSSEALRNAHHLEVRAMSRAYRRRLTQLTGCHNASELDLAPIFR